MKKLGLETPEKLRKPRTEKTWIMEKLDPLKTWTC